MKRKITLIQILFLCIFIVCGALVVKSYYDKNKTEKEIVELKEEIVQAEEPEEEYVPPEERPSDEAAPQPTEEPREANGMLTRYYALYNRNNDMAGWIKIYGTAVDYPVLHDPDSNSYYLHRNFDKQTSTAGVPFLDFQCDKNCECDNTVIYGHNMRNGTMFHQLLSYSNAAFLQQHKYIAYDTMYFRCVYEIFAVFRTAVGSADEFRYGEFITAESEEAYNAFVDECIKRSIISTGVRPSYREKLLTLSTCSYSRRNERFVVVARLIEKN